MVGGFPAQHGPEPSPHSDEEVELLNRPSRSPDFIGGNTFAALCGTVLNYGPMQRNETGRRDWYFCKTDRVDEFFADHAPSRKFVLVTHNSDLPVGEGLSHHLAGRWLRGWFAANVEVERARLHPIPLGVANPRWAHGDVELLARYRGGREKSQLFDLSFSVDTNPRERRYCIEQTGLEPAQARSFPEYLRHLAGSYFCVSPRGNGLDCHRTWEALYLRTVPVVTRSLLFDRHPDLPVIVLRDWSEFHSIDFGPELYRQVMDGWAPDELSRERYRARMEHVLSQKRARGSLHATLRRWRSSTR